MQEVILMYFTEAKWLKEGYVPSVEEYKSVALRSIAVLPVVTASFLDMGDIATKEVFEWVVKVPKIITASENICRLLDDIASHKVRTILHFVSFTVHLYSSFVFYFSTNSQMALVILYDWVTNIRKLATIFPNSPQLL